MKTTLTRLLTVIANDKGIENVEGWVKDALSHCSVVHFPKSGYLSMYIDKEHYIFGVTDTEFENKPFVLVRETAEQTPEGEKYKAYHIETHDFLQEENFHAAMGQCYDETILDITDLRVYFNEQPLELAIWVNEDESENGVAKIGFDDNFGPEEVVGVTANIYTLFLNDWELVCKMVDKRGYDLEDWEEYRQLYYGFNPVRKAYHALYFKDKDALLSQMVEFFEDFFTEKDEAKSGDLTEFLTTPLLRVTFEEKVFKPYIVKSQGQIIDVFLEDE